MSILTFGGCSVSRYERELLAHEDAFGGVDAFAVSDADDRVAAGAAVAGWHIDDQGRVVSEAYELGSELTNGPLSPLLGPRC